MGRLFALLKVLKTYNKPGSYQELDDKSRFTTTHLAWKSQLNEKASLALAAFFPLVVSILLFVYNKKKETGCILAFVLENRVTTQIIVTLISTALASLNVYTTTKLINFYIRTNLLKRHFSLEVISLTRGVCTQSWATGLSKRSLFASASMLSLFAIPQPLWTGALTPDIVNTTIVKAGALKIPLFSPSTQGDWSQNYRIGTSCYTVMNDLGVFSRCPVSVIQSNLLSRASQATRNLYHTKDDNTQYSFRGRSYGVGSSAGLVDQNLYNGSDDVNDLLAYDYTEQGYNTHVNCFLNTSIDFYLQEVQAPQPASNGIPYVYYARGVFPNKRTLDYFAVVGLDKDSDIAVVAAKHNGGQNVILITTGINYVSLNRTQCEVTFTPTKFDVHVDVANKSISVSISEIKPTTPSFDPADGLAATLMDQINALGMMSTTLFVSVIGNALLSNINVTTSDSYSSSSTSSPKTYSAIADSFYVMLDSILVFMGSSQFFLCDDFTTVDARLTVRAVRIGDRKFVCAALFMCSVLLSVFFVETCRTKVWQRLPRWDFVDTKDMVLASAVAGHDVVIEMCQEATTREMQWAGGGCDGWSSATSKKSMPTLGLRLGKKVISATQTCKEGDAHGYSDAIENPEVQLTAVSLWTRSAEDVAPLT